MTAADIADARRRHSEGESIRSLSKWFGVGFRKMQKVLAEPSASTSDLEPSIQTSISPDYVTGEYLRNGRYAQAVTFGGYATGTSTLAMLKERWPHLDLNCRSHVVEAINRWQRRDFRDAPFSQVDSPAPNWR